MYLQKTTSCLTGVCSLVVDSYWCLADCLSLLHEAAEGQGAPETLLHTGRRKNPRYSLLFTCCTSNLSIVINLCVFMQNIDTLERVAGLEGEDLIEAHGTFYTSHCVSFCCRKEYNLDWMKGVFCFGSPLYVTKRAWDYWVVVISANWDFNLLPLLCR